MGIPLLLGLSLWSFAAEAAPKYAPTTLPLHAAPQYFRKAEAPDFWALIPFYVPQMTGRSCSSSSVTIVLNALRRNANRKADERLISESEVLKRVPPWKRAVGGLGTGVTLEQLGELTRQALKQFEISATVDVQPWEPKDAKDPGGLIALRKILAENESSGDDFLIANFIQGQLTGDEGGGHISPIAAYDPVEKKVLVLDVDREWYEPYWVPDEALSRAMATRDSASQKNRGFIRIRLAKQK